MFAPFEPPEAVRLQIMRFENDVQSAIQKFAIELSKTKAAIEDLILAALSPEGLAGGGEVEKVRNEITNSRLLACVKYSLSLAQMKKDIASAKKTNIVLIDRFEK